MFTNFLRLPAEIQAKIWDQAAEDAGPQEGAIKVDLHIQLQSTQHSCWTTTDVFCGNHGTCPGYVYGDDKPSWLACCLADGYFSLPGSGQSLRDHAIQERQLHLNLACQDSLAAYRRRYPDVMRVYRGKWRAGIHSRTVRCNAVRDPLLLMNVHTVDCGHVQTGMTSLVSEKYARSIRDSALRGFPRSAQQFAAFRDILSRFQNFAILLKGDRDPTEEKGIDMTNSATIFMLFMESVQNMYIWPDASLWPEAWDKDSVRVEDTLQLDRSWGHEGHEFDAEADNFLGGYHEMVDVHRNQYAPSDEHWAPQPRMIERVGCYAAASWLDNHVDGETTEDPATTFASVQ